MKGIISKLFLTTLILFKIRAHTQSFKTIETDKLKLEVYNASENSFGVTSVIVSGKTIVKSTYEGKTSEENGKNLAKYVA